jgi:hypothetical protein
MAGDHVTLAEMALTFKLFLSAVAKQYTECASQSSPTCQHRVRMTTAEGKDGFRDAISPVFSVHGSTAGRQIYPRTPVGRLYVRQIAGPRRPIKRGTDP